jgi:hypothetical protein
MVPIDRSKEIAQFREEILRTFLLQKVTAIESFS